MLIVRHERFLQARSQRCFQLFLDDGVEYCTRKKKKMASERISQRAQLCFRETVVSHLNCCFHKLMCAYQMCHSTEKLWKTSTATKREMMDKGYPFHILTRTFMKEKIAKLLLLTADDTNML